MRHICKLTVGAHAKVSLCICPPYVHNSGQSPARASNYTYRETEVLNQATRDSSHLLGAPPHSDGGIVPGASREQT